MMAPGHVSHEASGPFPSCYTGGCSRKDRIGALENVCKKNESIIGFESFQFQVVSSRCLFASESSRLKRVVNLWLHQL